MYHSEQINELALALSKAQAEMTSATKGAKNPFFKTQYADINDVLMAARPSLNKHGLCIAQLPTQIKEDGGLVLVTMLMHSSGQWLKSFMPINVKSDGKNDLQALGGIITYLRRYSAASMCGIGSEDDDGNSSQAFQGQPQPTACTPKISPLQAKEIEDMLAKCEVGFQTYVMKFLAENKVSGIENMPVTFYDNIRNKIQTYVSQRAQAVSA